MITSSLTDLFPLFIDFNFQLKSIIVIFCLPACLDCHCSNYFAVKTSISASTSWSVKLSAASSCTILHQAKQNFEKKSLTLETPETD
jgi:hypothetical protein